MSGLELAVLAGGLAAIALVHWYFFLSERPVAVASTDAAGRQEVTIAVQGGYRPSVIRVRKHVPLRLTFDRQERSSCSEEVVLPAFGIKRFLPAFGRTAIDLDPTDAGTFDFTCGMGMLHGRLIVE